MTAPPLLTIVTVHLRDLPGLEMTLESARSCLKETTVEWVVVDGGTEPDSEAERRVLERARTLSDVYRSEPDEGIYDAMNKAVALASGRYVLFLNAGDCLHPDFHTRWLGGLPDPLPDMVWGQSWDRPRGQAAYPVHVRRPWWLHWGPALAHQAVFFRRRALGPAPYNTDFKVAADYDLICRLYRQGGRILRLNLPVCIFQLGGHSASNKLTTLSEEARIRHAHFRIPDWLNASVVRVKHTLWRINERFPGLRRRLRERL